MATLGSKKTTTYHRVNHSNRTSNLNKSLIYTAPQGGRTLVFFDLLTIDDFNSDVFLRKRDPVNGVANSATDVLLFNASAFNLVENFDVRHHISRSLGMGVGGTSFSTSAYRVEGDGFYMIMHPSEELRLSLNRDNDSNRYHLSFVTITES